MLLKLIRYLRFDPVTVFQKLGLTNDSSEDSSIFLRWYVERRFMTTGLAELFKRYGDLSQGGDINYSYQGTRRRISLTFLTQPNQHITCWNWDVG